MTREDLYVLLAAKPGGRTTKYVFYYLLAYEETYMSNSFFILARNSGTPPVKLLFDKSLDIHNTNNINKERKMVM